MRTTHRGGPRRPGGPAVPAALLALTALGLAACAAGGSAGGGGGDRSRITLLESSPKGVGWVVELVAQEQGYFKDEGLTVALQNTAGGAEAAQQLIARNVDFALNSASDALIGSTKSPGIRVLGCLYQKNIFSIQVPAGSGIRDVRQLKDKKLGITERGGGEDSLVDAALSTNGIKDSVQIVPVGSGPSGVRAVKRGEVDAFAGGLGEMVTMEAGGVALRDITPQRFAPLQSHCLATREDVLKDPAGRKAATKILRGLVRAAQFAAEDQKAALAIVCRTTPQACQKKEVAQGYMAKVVELATPRDEKNPAWYVDPEGWRATVGFLSLSGVLDQNDVDIDRVIGGSDVEQVKRAAYAGIGSPGGAAGKTTEKDTGKGTGKTP